MVEKGFDRDVIRTVLPLFDFLTVIKKEDIRKGVEYIWDVVQKTKQVCFYCLHKVWVALAICLVVLATVVSALRIALPYADSYKHQIEQMLSQQLGADVVISQISAAWHQTGPALILQQVRINSGEQLQLEIAQVLLNSKAQFHFFPKIQT